MVTETEKINTEPKSRRLLWVVLHAILLIVLTICLQQVTLIRTDEFAFLNMFGLIKHNLLSIDKKPVGDSVVFIDVSKDIALVDDTLYNGNVQGLGNAKISITDRAKLAKLFHLLNQHKGAYRYVLCDIQFSLPSADDSMLKAEIEAADNVIVTSYLDGNRHMLPLFNTNSGIVNYFYNGKKSFVKIPFLYGDSLKSLPVKMWEDLTGAEVKLRRGVTYINGSLAFNNIIPEFFYRNYDLSSRYKVFPLYRILMNESQFNKFLKDKYIVIGNFVEDIHDTYQGSMPGPLILFNVFLTLREFDNSISIYWIIMLLTFYIPVSYIIFNPLKKKDKGLDGIGNQFLKKYAKKYISYLGLFIVISAISFFVFHRMINVFYIITYLTSLEFVIDNASQFKIPNFLKRKK